MPFSTQTSYAPQLFQIVILTLHIHQLNSRTVSSIAAFLILSFRKWDFQSISKLFLSLTLNLYTLDQLASYRADLCFEPKRDISDFHE